MPLKSLRDDPAVERSLERLCHLARLLINVFLERMAERIDTIEISGPVVRSSNALVRVIDDLPVVLTPRAR